MFYQQGPENRAQVPTLIHTIISEQSRSIYSSSVEYVTKVIQNGFHANIQSTADLKVNRFNSAIDILFAFDIPKGCFIDAYEIEQVRVLVFY